MWLFFSNDSYNHCVMIVKKYNIHTLYSINTLSGYCHHVIFRLMRKYEFPLKNNKQDWNVNDYNDRC